MMLKPGSCTRVTDVSSLITRSLILVTPGPYLINCLFMISVVVLSVTEAVLPSNVTMQDLTFPYW